MGVDSADPARMGRSTKITPIVVTRHRIIERCLFLSIPRAYCIYPLYILKKNVSLLAELIPLIPAKFIRNSFLFLRLRNDKFHQKNTTIDSSLCSESLFEKLPILNDQ